MDTKKISENKSKHQFVVRNAVDLANGFQHTFRVNLLRLMHLNCNPALADDGHWDSEQAFYCSVDLLEKHDTWCEKDMVSWDKKELIQTLLDLDWKSTAINRFDKLLTDFEQCECGFQKSIQTGVCARCLNKTNQSVARARRTDGEQ